MPILDDLSVSTANGAAVKTDQLQDPEVSETLPTSDPKEATEMVMPTSGTSDPNEVTEMVSLLLIDYL